MNFFMVFSFAQIELPELLFFQFFGFSKISKTTIFLVFNPYLNVESITKKPF